jgi:hypothetical protein
MANNGPTYPLTIVKSIEPDSLTPEEQKLKKEAAERRRPHSTQGVVEVCRLST